MTKAYTYGRKVLKFDFQSEVIRDRFDRSRDSYQREVSASLSRRFKVQVHAEQAFTDVVLYHRLNNLYFWVASGDKEYTDIRVLIADLTLF